MALRNYMYFKHEDNLKEKIAHGIEIYSPEQILELQRAQGLIPNETTRHPYTLPNDNYITSTSHRITVKKKAKKLTPTQLRKLQRMKLQDDPSNQSQSNQMGNKNLSQHLQNSSYNTTQQNNHNRSNSSHGNGSCESLDSSSSGSSSVSSSGSEQHCH